jgi:hypothetical protein
MPAFDIWRKAQKGIAGPHGRLAPELADVVLAGDTSLAAAYEKAGLLDGPAKTDRRPYATSSVLRTARFGTASRIRPTSAHSGMVAAMSPKGCQRDSNAALRAHRKGEAAPAGIPKIVRCLSCDYV